MTWRWPIRWRTAASVVAAAWAAASCGGPAAEHSVLSNGMDALRADFVADSGKVRAIFLASPT